MTVEIVINVMGYRTRTVSSIFANLEKLVSRRAPRSGQALLGARWSFIFPSPETRRALCEYSFPDGPAPFVEALAARVGLKIIEHAANEASDLYHHIEQGNDSIVAIDSFFLPYRPAFNRVHSNRTIIVRQGLRRGEVLVEDVWPPGYQGPLLTFDLERARNSSVPLDPRLEPIYAGRPINGEWFSVDMAPFPIGDVSVWSAGLLQMLFLEATTATFDSRCEYGLPAMRRFCEELKQVLTWWPDERFDYVREASLLLRSELSARVYLCALLRASAGWIKEARLYEEARVYYEALRHMEMARDILIKSLARPRPEYAEIIISSLEHSVVAEERLAACLEPYATRVVVC
jgi:hypothetical protein